MTAPSVLPAMPALARPSASSSTSGNNAPAFADALGSALKTTRDTPRDAPSDDAVGTGARNGRAKDDTGPRAVPHDGTPGAATGAPDTDQAEVTTDPGQPATAPVPLAPGLWVLLATATPVTPVATAGTVPIGPTGNAAVDLATGTVAPGSAAAELVGGPFPTAGLPTTGLPTTGLPQAPAPAADNALPAPAAGVPQPATDPSGTASAPTTGFTLLLDPASANAVGQTAPAPAPAPATDQAPLLLPAPAWAGTSADTPDSGTGAPATPALAADPTAPTADTDSVFTLAGTTPTTGTTTTSAAPAAPAPATPPPPVAQQLGQHLAVLRNAADGSQTMTVVVTPDDLGPVTIAVTVSGGTLDLKLHGAHEAGRHALLDALPDLRRDLEGAGLSLSTLEVDTATGDSGPRSAQQQLLDARAGQQGAAGQPGQQSPRGRAWGAAPEPLAAGTPAATTDQSASSGVDVRV